MGISLLSFLQREYSRQINRRSAEEELSGEATMSKRSRLSRLNSVGEDETDCCMDGPRLESVEQAYEYEIDGGPNWSSCPIGNTSWHFNERSTYILSEEDCVVDNHSVSPLEASNGNDVLNLVQLTASTARNLAVNRIREYSGERRRKLQRQSSTELRELSSNLGTLDIDSCYEDDILAEDGDGDNLIDTAIILEQTSLGKMLISLIPCHSLLNRFNNLFQTSFHLAALTNNISMVRRLMVAGANVTLRDRFGNTALHIACGKGFFGVAKTILEPVRYPETKENSYPIPYQRIPQDLELRNSEGLTCLLIAAYRNDRPMLELLLSKHTDVNSYDMKNGKTCLHIFAETGNLNMMKFLLSNNRVDPNLTTYASFTAVELASYRGHAAIVAYLLSYGCNPVIRCITSGQFDAESSDSDLSDVE